MLEAVIGGGFAPVQPLDTRQDWEAAAVKARAGLQPAEREQQLQAMHREHRTVVDAARGIPEVDWDRKAEVTYEPGEAPFASSPDDILMWLRDHYREHVEQCPQLVEEWSKAGG